MARLQAALQREACTELPAWPVLLPFEPALIKEYLELYFNHRTEALPVQSELCSYTLISTSNNQSE